MESIHSGVYIFQLRERADEVKSSQVKSVQTILNCKLTLLNSSCDPRNFQICKQKKNPEAPIADKYVYFKSYIRTFTSVKSENNGHKLAYEQTNHLTPKPTNKQTNKQTKQDLNI